MIFVYFLIGYFAVCALIGLGFKQTSRPEESFPRLVLRCAAHSPLPFILYELKRIGRERSGHASR